MEEWKYFVEEFKKTRGVSKKYFKIGGTILYTGDVFRGLPKRIIFSDNTVKEILKNNDVAALNFADAYNPGGLVLSGANTQEECLCRSSNLYEYLIREPAFYKYSGDDWLMVHNNVTFFRDENLNFIREPKICDIITCASQMFPPDEEETKRRMKNIIRSCDKDTLILGKWGCGAFGNDWNVFKDWWKECIDECGVKEVIW